MKLATHQFETVVNRNGGEVDAGEVDARRVAKILVDSVGGLYVWLQSSQQ